MTNLEVEGQSQRLDDSVQIHQTKGSEQIKNEPFNLLKRVILLEERTRQFEDSQVNLSILGQRVDEIVQSQNLNLTTERQRLIYDLEKKVIMIDDKIVGFENQFKKLFEKIHKEIQVNQPQQQSDFQQEVIQLYEIVQNLDRQFQAKMSQMKEEMDKSYNQTQNSLKDIYTRLDKQETNDQQKNHQEESNIPQKSRITNPLNSDQNRYVSNYDFKSYNDLLDAKMNSRESNTDPIFKKDGHNSLYNFNVSKHTIDPNLESRLSLLNQAPKSLLQLQNNDKYNLVQVMGQKQQQMVQFKSKDDELNISKSKQYSVSKEPQRDLSGYRASQGQRPNPYKQRDFTNVKERQLNITQDNQRDTDFKLEQTKRFIDDEITRRYQEDLDKKNSEQKPQPFSSLRDQLNHQYQKKYP